MGWLIRKKKVKHDEYQNRYFLATCRVRFPHIDPASIDLYDLQDMLAIDKGSGITASFKEYINAMNWEPEKPKTDFLNTVKGLMLNG